MPIDAKQPYDDQNIFARILRGEIPNKTVMETEHSLELPRGLQVDFAQKVQAITDLRGDELTADELLAAFHEHYLAHSTPYELGSYTHSSADEDHIAGLIIDDAPRGCNVGLEGRGGIVHGDNVEAALLQQRHDFGPAGPIGPGAVHQNHGQVVGGVNGGHHGGSTNRRGGDG